MIANFAEDVNDVWVFLEDGDLEVLQESGLEGRTLDIGHPGREPGTIRIDYEDDYFGTRPSVGVNIEDEGVNGLELVVGDDLYQKLDDDNIYHDRIGSFQELPEASKMWIFPSGEKADYGYMWEDLQFYRDLTVDQRAQYRQRLEENG